MLRPLAGEARVRQIGGRGPFGVDWATSLRHVDGAPALAFLMMVPVFPSPSDAPPASWMSATFHWRFASSRG